MKTSVAIIAGCVVLLTLVVLLRELQHQADRHATIELQQQRSYGDQ
jgi:hypothetical protein